MSWEKSLWSGPGHLPGWHHGGGTSAGQEPGGSPVPATGKGPDRDLPLWEAPTESQPRAEGLQRTGKGGQFRHRDTAPAPLQLRALPKDQESLPSVCLLFPHVPPTHRHRFHGEIPSDGHDFPGREAKIIPGLRSRLTLLPLEAREREWEHREGPALMENPALALPVLLQQETCGDAAREIPKSLPGISHTRPWAPPDISGGLAPTLLWVGAMRTCWAGL